MAISTALLNWSREQGWCLLGSRESHRGPEASRWAERCPNLATWLPSPHTEHKGSVLSCLHRVDQSRTLVSIDTPKFCQIGVNRGDRFPAFLKAGKCSLGKDTDLLRSQASNFILQEMGSHGRVLSWVGGMTQADF